MHIENYIHGNNDHAIRVNPQFMKPPGKTQLRSGRRAIDVHARSSSPPCSTRLTKRSRATARSVPWPWRGCWPDCSRRWRCSPRCFGWCRWRPWSFPGWPCGGSPSARPDLVGRPAALAGLLLGTAFLVAAPVDDLVYRYFLRQQARQFAEIWIDAVRHGEVYKAHHLMIDPEQRLPLENNLADFYRQNANWRRMLNVFVKEPAMRTLFALGPAAEIRFYETAAEGRQDASTSCSKPTP